MCILLIGDAAVKNVGVGCWNCGLWCPCMFGGGVRINVGT